MLVQFSSPSGWEAALPKVSGCCKLGNAVGSCPRHPEPSRQWERGWSWGLQTRSQLIFVNRAANCGLAESGEHQQLCQDLPGAFSLSLAGFIEEPERKYCFECATEEQCQEWVEALKRARWAEPSEPGQCWGLWAVFWDQELGGQCLSPPRQASLQLEIASETSPHPSLLSLSRALFLSCSYEFLRRSLIFYRNEIQKMTGKVSESLQGSAQV